MDEEEGQGSLDGYESDRSLDNEAVVRLEDDSETEDDHDDDPSGSRQPVTGRGRHFAVWDDHEIDVVWVEPFAGNPGYRGQPLGGQGDEDQDDEGEGGNGHRRHVEPIMVWRQFFTEDLIVCLVIETNRYATLLTLKPRPASLREDYPWPPKFLERWKAVTRREMEAWLALTYAFGVHVLPSPLHHWSTRWILETPQFRKVMSRDRFQQIKACLHVANDLLPLLPNQLPKIGSFMEKFEARCREVYYPTAELAFDEMMVRFEGRSTFNYKKQRKPTGDGMKIYGVAEARSGYLFAFELDRRNGKKIEEFVLDSCAKLEPVYHRVYFDNLFTSVALFKTLHERHTYACGTVRANRGLPPELTEKACKFAHPGMWKWKMAPPQLLAVGWQDTGHTTMLSNFHQPQQEVILRRVKGKRQRQNRLAPSCAADYNKFMGAVDQADALRASYTAQLTSRKWWHPLFYNIMDVAMCNAFIVHGRLSGQAMSHLAFVEQVCQGLIGGYTDALQPVPVAKRVRVNPASPPATRTVGSHWPCESTKGRCVECYAQGRTTKYSRMSCERCGVHLHPECFKVWHLK